MNDNNKINIEVNDSLNGFELKEKVSSLTNYPKEKIRFFFGGAEIKDEHKLFQHNLKDEFIIQLMIRSIES